MNRMPSVLLFVGGILALIILIEAPGFIRPPDRMGELRGEYPRSRLSGTDHAALPPLQKDFASPREVSRACASCHTERHAEFMDTPHWRWSREEYVPGRGVISLGKINAINNFCIGIAGSEQSCNRCHAGYGWSEGDFDFEDAEAVDCLACHDNSGEYIKEIEMGGDPAPDVDLRRVAQGVGRPTTVNCGSCHFSGGGGNNVKHGDLEEALLAADRDLDVHMALEGAAMHCVDCHGGEAHNIRGRLYTVSSTDRNRVRCGDCHGELPHGGGILDEHNRRVACQTCHIPLYAKAKATKIGWDWSTAGRLVEGEPIEEHDEDGNETYLSIKGDFSWGRNLEPEYFWFNGTAEHHLLGDAVDTTRVVSINRLLGDAADGRSQIVPAKVMRTRQPYDRSNMTLIQPWLFSPEEGEGAYWKDFDWQRAASAGMALAGQPFSGDLDFIETQMFWPVNHMVAPADQALGCAECHRRGDGRLAGVEGFYLPGRDANPIIEASGKGLLLLALAGILLHSLLRVLNVLRRRRGARS